MKNNKAFINKLSSRSISVRDIMLFLLRPILRTATLRNDEAGARGFTLIELLVVVLIIGILSVIALPQYQKAVLKSQITKSIVTLRGLDQAQIEYNLANGVYSIDKSNLGFSISGVAISCSAAGSVTFCMLYDPSIDNSIVFEWQGYTDGTRRWICEARQLDRTANAICSNLQKEWNGTATPHDADNYTYYKGPILN